VTVYSCHERQPQTWGPYPFWPPKEASLAGAASTWSDGVSDKLRRFARLLAQQAAVELARADPDDADRGYGSCCRVARPDDP